MNHSPAALHLNLDEAWLNEPFGLPVVDARSWGPQLRFSAPPRVVAKFYREHETHLAAPFLLYGSGDFHYLTALRLRRLAGPIELIENVAELLALCECEKARRGPVPETT